MELENVARSSSYLLNVFVEDSAVKHELCCATLEAMALVISCVDLTSGKLGLQYISKVFTTQFSLSLTEK